MSKESSLDTGMSTQTGPRECGQSCVLLVVRVDLDVRSVHLSDFPALRDEENPLHFGIVGSPDQNFEGAGIPERDSRPHKSGGVIEGRSLGDLLLIGARCLPRRARGTKNCSSCIIRQGQKGRSISEFSVVVALVGPELRDLPRSAKNQRLML